MSLYPDDAPSTARACNECDGRGKFIERWPDGDIRRIDECEKCDGGGRVLCVMYSRTRPTPNCTSFAVHFFADGDDDLCEWCWSHCSRCSEKVIEVSDGVFCPFCNDQRLAVRPRAPGALPRRAAPRADRPPLLHEPRADPAVGRRDAGEARMTPTERQSLDRATETVRAMGELARQDWWMGWIAFLDHARERMPDVLEPRQARRWPWMPRPVGRLLTFEVPKAAKRRRR